MEKKKTGFKAPTFAVPAKKRSSEANPSEENQGKTKSAKSDSLVKQSKIKQKSKVLENKLPKKEKKTVADNPDLPVKVNKSDVKAEVDERGDGTDFPDGGRGDRSDLNNTVDKLTDYTGDIDSTGEASAGKPDKTTNDSDTCDKDIKEETEDVAKISLGKRKHEDGSNDKDRKLVKQKVTLPVRSLTDDEYEAIFAAAIENALNLNIDEWSPQSTKAKKYKRTVGKPVEPLKEKKIVKPNVAPGKVEKDNKKVKVSKDKFVNKEKMKNVPAEDKENIPHNKGHGSNEDTGKIQPDQTVSNQPTQPEIKSEAQVENETTPVGSGDEQTTVKVHHSPPHKKIKKSSSKGLKNPKLEPKHLPFGSQGTKMKKQKCEHIKSDTNIRKDPEKKRASIKFDLKQSSTDKHKKIPVKKINRRKEMLEREINVKGTWVQCCRTDCRKWRYLPNVSDPMKVPDYWTCNMNTREEYNSCEKMEEAYDETDHIYTKFCEGSIVWAKMAGYPWWPAMVEIDPDCGIFFETDENNNMVPTYYHVVFLDEKVSRTWIKTNQIMPFNRDDERPLLNNSIKRKKGSSIEKELNAAKRNALDALDCPLQERIKTFGFAAKFKGHWGTDLSNDTNNNGSPKVVKKIKIKSEVKEEAIDDTTIDDVLGNTEAILSNVEEMLDSLESPVDDSDEDSDFSLDEMVCIEGRKKSERKNDCTKTTTQGKIYSDSSSDEIETEEMVKKESGDKCVANNDEIDDADGLNSHNGSNPDHSKKSTFKDKLNFDCDIFTMELGHDANDDAKENVVQISTETTDTEKKNSEVETDIGNDISSKTDVVIKTESLNHEKIDENKNKKKKKSEMNDSESKLKKGEKMKDDNKVKANKKGEKHKSKISTKSVDTIGQSNTSNDMPNLTLNSNDIDTASETIQDENTTNKMSNISTVYMDNETESNLKNDKINELDTEQPPSDKEVLEELNTTAEDDSLVPDIQDAKTDTNPDLSATQEGISLEDESEVDFDFEEQSLYDSSTAGADKVRERVDMIITTEIHPLPVIGDEEDSDPFDMIEE